MTTINVNIPEVNTASFQPNFTKTVEFPGVTIYHSLKERYYITTGLQPSIRSEPDPLLRTLNRQDGFAYIIGGNSSHFYTAICEHALLGRTQVNPATGDVIAEDIINVNDLVVPLYAGATECFITSGYVLNNLIILGVCTNPGGTITMTPKLLCSFDNGLNWYPYDFTGESSPEANGMPVSITPINFNAGVFYWILLRSQTVNNYSYYLISAEDLLEQPYGTNPILYSQSSSNPHTHNTNRYSINIESKFVNNAIYFLNDTREYYYELMTNLYSGLFTSYTIPNYELGPFVESVSPALSNERYTQIDLKNGPTTSNIYKLDETVSSSSNTSNFDEVLFDKFVLWNKLDPQDTIPATAKIINIQPYGADIILLLLDSGTLSVRRGEIFDDNLQQDLILNNTAPLTRFNSPNFTTGELVDPLPGSWLANDNVSSWVSDRADTDLHDYGNANFDYPLLFILDLPIALTTDIRFQYYGEVLDVRVNGTSVGISDSGNEGTWQTGTLTFPRGQSELLFNMRKPSGSPGAGNPTGLRLEFTSTVDVSTFLPTSGYSDLFVDLVTDRFYVSYDTFMWVCDLNTFTVLYVADLHAELLVLDPPYPPDWDPLFINGVTDDVHIPVQWKFLKNFNNVYAYNTKHHNTYTNTDPKEFYLWEIRDDDVTGLRMFAAFELDPINIAKIQYFYSTSNELHQMIGNSSNTTQYRLNGLAQFNLINTDPVTVGPIKYSDVLVGLDGKIYVSEGDDPDHNQANSALFVYVNPNAANPSSGSYLIAVDSSSNAYTYLNYSPPSDSVLGEENFGLSKKFAQLPGDYFGNFIVGSDVIRDENYNDLQSLNSNNLYLSATDNPNSQISSDSELVISKLDNEWLYAVAYNTTTTRYEIYRARAVYYPYT